MRAVGNDELQARRAAAVGLTTFASVNHYLPCLCYQTLTNSLFYSFFHSSPFLTSPEFKGTFERSPIDGRMTLTASLMRKVRRMFFSQVGVRFFVFKNVWIAHDIRIGLQRATHISLPNNL
jgi:hypothetical protein